MPSFFFLTNPTQSRTRSRFALCIYYHSNSTLYTLSLLREYGCTYPTRSSTSSLVRRRVWVYLHSKTTSFCISSIQFSNSGLFFNIKGATTFRKSHYFRPYNIYFYVALLVFSPSKTKYFCSKQSGKTNLFSPMGNKTFIYFPFSSNGIFLISTIVPVPKLL